MDRSLARVRAMSARELPFRIRQQWTLATDRWWTPAPPPPGAEPRWPGPYAPRPIADRPPPDLADPRLQWEAGRLQTASAEVASAWLAANPPGRGPAWESAMEVALRLVSLARWATEGPAPSLRAAVHAHAQWVARHPSRGSSANNHRVAELGALALAGAALGVTTWRDEAAELPFVLRAQLHPDGGGVEQSPSYLAYDLEWAMLARRSGVEGLDEPIARGARLLGALLDDTGALPSLGDDDDGRVVATADREDAYARSVAGAAGVAAPGYAPDARAVLVGAGGDRCAARRGSITFPDAGLTVLVGEGSRLVFDHGPLGGAFLAAHGHADALAVYLHDAYGPVVVGRGTGCYRGDPAARRFHRGTSAHPTVEIDGADQSEPANHPFLWRSRAECRLEVADPGGRWARARHDGYARRGVVHRRTVRGVGGEWVVEDELLGAGLHHVALHWPLAPGLRADADGAVWSGARLALRVAADPLLGLAVVSGGPRPGLGWHSPRYGEWVPADALVSAGVLRLPARVRTVLRPGP